jgi:hypothetical protein
MTNGGQETAEGSGFLRFWTWAAWASLTRAVGAACGGAHEAQVREVLGMADRLLKAIEDEAAAAGEFLPRVPPRRAGEDAAGDQSTAPDRILGMTVEEFLEWQQNEPDSYELIDGVPVRMAEEKQGNRRVGRVFAAAKLALGFERGSQWLKAPTREFGGKPPFLVAAESWKGLVAVVEMLRGRAAAADHAPEGDEAALARPGESLDSLLEQASRMAAIELARRSGLSEMTTKREE